MTVTTNAPLVAGDVRPRAAMAESLAPTGRHVDAEGTVPDIVDVWGHGSFPASDPPANW